MGVIQRAEIYRFNQLQERPAVPATDLSLVGIGRPLV